MYRSPGFVVPASSSQDDTTRATEAVRKLGNAAGYEQIDFVELENSLAQSDATEVDDFLEHYGVKGMKWGVRNADHGASNDAQESGSALRKAKTSGLHTLSNKELQAVITRMNLEQQYARLNPSASSKAIGFVTGLIGHGNTINQVISFVNSPAGKAITKTLTSALKNTPN